MTPAMRPDAYRPDDDTGYDRTSARLTVIGGADAAPWAPGDPVRPTSARDLTPIVHLPFPPVAAPEPEPVPPQIVAEASLPRRASGGDIAIAQDGDRCSGEMAHDTRDAAGRVSAR